MLLAILVAFLPPGGVPQPVGWGSYALCLLDMSIGDKASNKKGGAGFPVPPAVASYVHSPDLGVRLGVAAQSQLRVPPA